MEPLVTISTGISTAIIKVLKSYSKKIPVDFLAKSIGRSTPEIQGYLEDLKDEGIIKLDGDDVSIAEKSEK